MARLDGYEGIFGGRDIKRVSVEMNDYNDFQIVIVTDDGAKIKAYAPTLIVNGESVEGWVEFEDAMRGII